MSDLRTLAQAVVDDPDSVEARTALGRWIGFHRDDCPAASLAVDILAALDAERDATRAELAAAQAEVSRLRALAPVDPFVQDPLTTIRVLRERLAKAVASHVFQDQIDADRVALEWTADMDPESMPERGSFGLAHANGRVLTVWSTRGARPALTKLAVVVRDDFNRSVVVTVDVPPAT